MSQTLVDLWPSEVIGPEILSPRTILRHQAEKLRERTRGLVIGLVAETKAVDRVVERFEIESPTLEVRYLLFQIERDPSRSYPVRVIANDGIEVVPNFLRSPATGETLSSEAVAAMSLSLGAMEPTGRVAANQDEFVEIVRDIFASPEVVSLISSLIADANDRSNPNSRDESGPKGQSSTVDPN